MDQEQKKKRGPPTEVLGNKQIFPMIGLGTYKVTNDKEILNVLKAALQVGYRHIDSAILYQHDEALGAAIDTCIKEGRCKREDLFISTKTFNHVDKNPITQLRQALRRLNLKYVDLYYLHVPALGLDGQGKWTHRQICEVWKDMEQCVRRGYTKHLGISNFNGQNVLDLLSYCKIKPIVNQIQYHPYCQSSGLVEICQKNGIFCVAFTPLGRPGARQDINIIKDETIIQIAQKYSKTPAQIVLKYILSRGMGVIPKTKTIERLKQNYESWNFQLAQQDVKKIKALHRNLRVCQFQAFFPPQVDLFS